mgnify:FL=1
MLSSPKFVVTILAVLGLGCGSQDNVHDLGPVDGRDMHGVDLERIQVGQSAPDFTLASLSGSPVTLSGFRGDKNVVLVFYRGKW